VMTGAGRGFCAGADIRFESEAGDEEFAEFIDGIQDLTRALRAGDLYVVAALNGVAVGGGMELALACDARVAVPEAAVGFPEIKLGLTVTGGVLHTLPRLAGPSRALELLVSGRSLTAEAALEYDLVDRLSTDPVADAIRLAAIAEDAPPGLLSLVKSGLHAGSEATMEDALAIEHETIMNAFRRPAARERLRAFVDRRRAT
jgi:enoyl-CoA hydratase/carnithine racemase